MSLALRFRRRFSMAHRLPSGPAKKCASPHGHDEYVSVELVAARPERLDGQGNMVVEFGRAKSRWHRFVDERLDHALQLSASDPLLAIAREHFDWRLVVTPGDPTTELMAALLAAKCQAILDDELDGALRVRRVILEETPTNSVIFEGDPREVLPAGDGWWWRPDESTS